MFNVGGVVYVADADTAISGTDSGVIKITPAGATASASYVSTFTGIAWNDAYRGYYDISGNFYFIDEEFRVTVRTEGTEQDAFVQTGQRIKPLDVYSNSGYVTVATITLTVPGKIPVFVKGMHLEVNNPLFQTLSKMRVRIGSTDIESWDDEENHITDLSIETLITAPTMVALVQYLEYGANDNRGPFTVDVSLQTVPDCPFGLSDKNLLYNTVGNVVLSVGA